MERDDVNNNVASLFKLCHKGVNMDMALVRVFYELLDGDYSADLREIILSFANPSFLTLSKQAIPKLGISTPGQQLANFNAMTASKQTNAKLTKL